MIAGIHGVLEARRVDHAIIRVGGFSLRVLTPSSTLSRLGEVGAEVTLYTHFRCARMAWRCMASAARKIGTPSSS